EKIAAVVLIGEKPKTCFSADRNLLIKDFREDSVGRHPKNESDNEVSSGSRRKALTEEPETREKQEDKREVGLESLLPLDTYKVTSLNAQLIQFLAPLRDAKNIDREKRGQTKKKKPARQKNKRLSKPDHRWRQHHQNPQRQGNGAHSKMPRASSPQNS
ncbi:hypothetical protein OAE92_03145, partial [Akkermansiaceae bacterium]|nr:hypothetical protein [Akkermansiaceae bacterium]